MATISLADRIRSAREAAGLTQAQAAELAGMAQANWARLESGSRDPQLSTLRAVADALGVTVGELAGDAE